MAIGADSKDGPRYLAATDEAARLWQVERPGCGAPLRILEHGGLVENMRTNQAQQNDWRIAPAAHPVLTSPACR